MPVLLRCLLAACLAAPPVFAALPGQPRPPAPPGHDATHGAPQLARDADWAPYRLLEGMSQYLPAALRAARQPNVTFRRGGLFILGMLMLPEGVGAARQGLRDPERLVRMQAGVALAMMYRPEGLAAAAEGLRTGPEWCRLYALHGLWRLDSARARKALRDSRPYTSGFLLQTLDEALAAGPRFRCANVRHNQPDEGLSIYRLWNDISGEFVRESDLWWHKGNYDQSIRAQQTALFFDPEYVDLWTNIAWLQWSMGRHADAISTYRQCLAANPKAWDAHQALADYYWRHGQKLVAVKYYEQAAACQSPPVARRRLGHAYRDLGEPEKAIRVWQDILEMDPNDPIARRELDRAR